MIRFLIQRPIAVLMAFLACFILGVITYNTLAVSLLPDIAIPEITVQVPAENRSARELENTLVSPLRRQLLQVAKLREIQSETRDGAALIQLKFDHGTNTDLAFIEVNEKIDATMNNLPRDIQRPRVIKASATDIPVFYLNLSLREQAPFTKVDEELFLDLSSFADQVVKRRIEQLPEVAMADMTGLMHRQLQIIPNLSLLEAAAISIQDLEHALVANNIEPGSMLVREGYYEYNIKFSNLLRSPEDVQNIYLKKNNRIFQLKDLAEVKLQPKPETGVSLINGKRCITLGVIKQADETMKNLKNSLLHTLKDLEDSYPEIEFQVNRNQTELLDYTISNLQQNLSLGLLLIFIVALLFLGDAKSPLVIGLSMLTSLATSFLFFYLFKQSLNIISLSGMILALGMMIDSAIIVTDIIGQYRTQGYALEEACIKGTNEVITPILSSTLTTIAVFVPLVFMSGIAGAIFFAQAFAVSVGLLVSYLTGIILLPVLYRLIYSLEYQYHPLSKLLTHIQQKVDLWIFKRYDRGADFIFRHKTASFLFLALSIPFCVLMFYLMPKSSMPQLDHLELTANIDWNENIHLDENQYRIAQLLSSTQSFTSEDAAYLGHKQYLLNKETDLTSSEAQLYFKSAQTNQIEALEAHIKAWLQQNYPQAIVSFSPPENIFEKIFDTAQADLITQLTASNKSNIPDAQAIKEIQTKIQQATDENLDEIAFEQQLLVKINQDRLLLYGVNYTDVYYALRTAFQSNQIAILRSFQQYLPISLALPPKAVSQVLQETFIETQTTPTQERVFIPLIELVSVEQSEDIKTLIAGKDGEYIPLTYAHTNQAEKIIEQTKQVVNQEQNWEVHFAGAFFSNQKMIGELVLVLFVSMLLMYFILAAQFESFLQPLIVLIEIPIDIGFALVVLRLTGNTLNLMSAIGLIVVTGVVINDSILKLDMMNELRKDGVELMEAIHTAGVKRLRAIVMTSLTTICAMIPILFSFDFGSELQKPLAIAMISTMLIGMAVSLFLVPLVYWSIYRKSESTKNIPVDV